MRVAGQRDRMRRTRRRRWARTSTPDRGYTTSGPGFVAQGDVQSGRGLFPIPYVV